jgi:transcriptional/translational regulatory protein YebC/TACO1
MDIVLEAGAEDIADSGAEWEIETMPENLNRVKRALEEGGVRLLSAKVSMIPSNTIKIEDERQAQQVLNLMNALEENDDVQNVYANFDIPEELLEKVA